jgi:hypothetical protein
MIWILNMIVSANLRRVSIGISANGLGLCEGWELELQMFKICRKVQ